MDEKFDKFQKFDKRPQVAMAPDHRPQRRVRPLLLVSTLALCFYIFARPLAAFDNFHEVESLAMQQPVVNRALVPLEAHVMSKCPDAKDCLREMILPTMQRVYDKVNFTLSYIGTPTENDGVECMHGPEECLGNIIQLCAAALYPGPKTYLGFSMCMMRDYQDIPQRSLIEDCALEHAIDFEKLSDCTAKDDGAYGMKMLRNSVRRTSRANVTKSCTVRLDKEIYCIRDGGEWKDCPHGAKVDDLVIAIERLYRPSS